MLYPPIVYTRIYIKEQQAKGVAMEIVKIRRVGNSNVVTLPRSFEAAGYVAGSSVVLDQTPTGDLLMIPESRARGDLRELGRRLVAEHAEGLALLEAYDRGEATLDGDSLRSK